MRGDSGVAGDGRVVGIPKFHSWGKCTMPLTNINSDWMSNALSGLCINLIILFTRVLQVASWGVMSYTTKSITREIAGPVLIVETDFRFLINNQLYFFCEHCLPMGLRLCPSSEFSKSRVSVPFLSTKCFERC